jgi:hypothetical protein
MNPALAAEGTTLVELTTFHWLFSSSRNAVQLVLLIKLPSGAKARCSLVGNMYGPKPVPFKIPGIRSNGLLAAETIDDARIKPNVLHLRRAPKGGQPIPWLYTCSKSGTKVVVNRHTERQTKIDPLAP